MALKWAGANRIARKETRTAEAAAHATRFEKGRPQTPKTGLHYFLKYRERGLPF